MAERARPSHTTKEMLSMTYLLADGGTAQTLTEVATALGVDKVTNKDIKAGGKYADLVSITNSDDDVSEELADAVLPEEIDGDETAQDSTDSFTDTAEEFIENPATSEELPLTKAVVLESLPKFVDLAELKDFIKDIDDELLEKLATALECEWTPNPHKQINRMRVALSMHRFFFPENFQPKEAKKKGKYGDKTDAELEKMAKEHKLTYVKSGNQSINRMRLIMALKQAGHLAE